MLVGLSLSQKKPHVIFGWIEYNLKATKQAVSSSLVNPSISFTNLHSFLVLSQDCNGVIKVKGGDETSFS